MKKLLLAAVSFCLLATQAFAQSYSDPPRPGYRAQTRVVATKVQRVRYRRLDVWCQSKSARLREFDRQAQITGRVSRDEARIANSLQADLSNNCSPGGG